jgi:hypothetical protein
MIRSLLERPIAAGWINESVFDFYARLVDPQLTARRVIARVEVVRTEARGTTSFVLRPRPFRAGQHVDLTVEINGVRRTRSYSPSNAPDSSGRVVITVKRHPEGLVSGWLHDHLREGDLVELSQPYGDFVLDPENERVLAHLFRHRVRRRPARPGIPKPGPPRSLRRHARARRRR